MTSIVPNDFLARASPAWSLRGSEPSNFSRALAEPNSGVVRWGRVVDDRDAADRSRDRDGEKGQHQDLLTPLAAKQAPGPADHGAARGDAATFRSGQRRWTCERHSSSITRREQRLWAGRRDGLVDDVAVAQEDDAVGPGRELRLVGHDDTGDARCAWRPARGA